MTQDQLAVMSAEDLTEFGVASGYDDMLNPSDDAVAAADDLMASIRASDIMHKAGSMTAGEFKAVMQKMMEMVNGASP